MRQTTMEKVYIVKLDWSTEDSKHIRIVKLY